MSKSPKIEVSEPAANIVAPVNAEVISDPEMALKAIDQILEEADVSDVMVNDCNHVFIEQNGQMHHAPFVFSSNDLVSQVAVKLVQRAEKEEMLQKSFVADGMLPGGHRLTIVMPPASLGSATICIRRFQRKAFSLDKMVESGLLTPRLEKFLSKVVERRANILISGNTSSGKTTLLNALTKRISSSQRIVTIEDTAELDVQQDNIVRLEIDSLASHSENNAITARALLKSSLRIRPDRIIMGEIRGAEAFEFIQAINTGHKGSMATVHANTPRETLTRLEHMVSMGVDLPANVIKQQITSSLDLVIQTYRNHKGTRRISHITEVVGMEGDTMITHEHFVYKRGQNGEIGYLWNRTNSRNHAIQEAINAASEV